MDTIKSHRAFDGTVKFLEHDSVSTRTRMRLSVYEPGKTPQGVLIWLSGLTCSEENFITKAGALPHLSRHGLVLVCPDTSPRGLELKGEHDSYDFGSGASFYVDAKTEGYRDHYNMHRYIAEELYGLLEKRYALSNKTALFGHSMGGHGALTIGLNHPEKFTSLSAFAPIANPMKCPWGQKCFRGYLGSNEAMWQNYDACELLISGKTHSKPLLVHQGLADEFMETQLKPDALESACKEAGQALQLERVVGYDHSYYFIASFIEMHIEFHLSQIS